LYSDESAPRRRNRRPRVPAARQAESDAAAGRPGVRSAAERHAAQRLPLCERVTGGGGSLGFYNRECTSFVAYRLNRLKHFKFTNYMAGGHFGDAGHWDDNARALGFTVNKHPTVGAVMVRDSGTWGHVAIVSKVKRKRFLVEEYNHDVSHGYGKRWLSRSRSSSDWDHFIHFRS
jgi:hypothetical protein